MKQLLYVRHGETHHNANGLISGQIETSLNEKGIEQAKATGKELHEKFPKIDLVVCSPLERTCETAKYIAAEIGYPVDKIQKSDLLLERSFGILEATPGKDFFEEHEYKDIDTADGAETVEELQKRAEVALKYLQGLNEDTVLVVGHGAFGRAIRRVVQGLPHTHEYEVKTPIGNAEIVELV